jgi:NAD+ kinase
LKASIKKIGIICKAGRPEPLQLLGEVLPWLTDQGAEVLVETEAARFMGIPGHTHDRIAQDAEMIVVFGGDGTMLSVAREVCCRALPILGVNLGGLGFITEVNKDDVFTALATVLSGRFHYEDRLMLMARVIRNGETIAEYTALNDIVINKSALARIVDLETFVNNAFVTRFRSDGLIVSTPTGSTAYCLSAGGPILYPTMENIVLIPICPHTLTNRPIVLPRDARIEIVFKASGEDVFLTVDGQIGFSLMKGDRIVVCESPHKTRLIIPSERDFFEVLRTKLGWGERPLKERQD